MRALKRAGASLLALGVAAAGMVMSAPIASAHTGTLSTSSVCQNDGTYKITYVGKTRNVPRQGVGHVATLTVGEIKPVGTTITDAPATVTGNTTYTFTQTVPGTATLAQATAFLVWGDGVKSDPIGVTSLRGNCTVPVAPSGDLATSCVNGGGQVAAANLNNGTATSVSWRLVSGTDASHDTVVAGPSANAPLVANNLPDATKVWLQFNAGNGWVDEGSVVTTGNCAPVVPPSGSFTVVCSAVGANVTIGTLGFGTRSDVAWTLTFGSESKTVSSGDVVAVPALAALSLKYSVGGGDSHTVQSATAPAACVPTGERSLDIVKSVSPTGDAQFGDTLTYTLKVTAGGTLGQTNVVVSDYIPGYKPGRDSGKSTYVGGSAACDAGPCTTSYDNAAKLVTWGLGDMAAGTSRMVTFQVTIDTPAATATGGVPATTIFNSAAVASTETSTKPSNEVQTPVTAVLGVKVGKPAHHEKTKVPPAPAVSATVLPHTGASGRLPWTLGAAALLLLLGSALILVAREPEAIRER